MKPREFLSVAHQISEINTEAAYRSAISRAYYAAFHKGLEVLETIGTSPRAGSGGHEDVYRFLLNSGTVQVKRAGALLNSLKTVRTKADYYLGNQEVNDPLKVLQELGNAEKIIKNLEGISSPEKATIRKNILEYKRKIQ